MYCILRLSTFLLDNVKVFQYFLHLEDFTRTHWEKATQASTCPAHLDSYFIMPFTGGLLSACWIAWTDNCLASTNIQENRISLEYHCQMPSHNLAKWKQKKMSRPKKRHWHGFSCLSRTAKLSSSSVFYMPVQYGCLNDLDHPSGIRGVCVNR